MRGREGRGNMRGKEKEGEEGKDEDGDSNKVDIFKGDRYK